MNTPVETPKKTHVVIATTEGHAFVQRITEEESGVQSVICLDGTVQVLPVSAEYHAFVRRGGGVIARDFGHDAFRIDVDARIDQGCSWQLPVYLAHALKARGELGNGKPESGDIVYWATGEVDVDLAVRPVAGVAQKLAHAIAPVRELRARGVDVRLLLPADNAGDQPHFPSEIGITGVARLCDVLPQTKAGAPGKAPASSPGSAPMEAVSAYRLRAWRWALLAVLLLGAGLVTVYLLQAPGDFPQRRSSPDLDDFGARPG